MKSLASDPRQDVMIYLACLIGLAVVFGGGVLLGRDVEGKGDVLAGLGFGMALLILLLIGIRADLTWAWIATAVLFGLLAGTGLDRHVDG